MKKIIQALVTVWLSVSAPSHAQSSIEQINYRILQALPHAPQNFTQGLAVEADQLWESSGLYGKSRLQLRRKHDQKLIADYHYDRNRFAEGIALFDEYLYGLSWRSGEVYRWHKQTLTLDAQFSIEGQGWGMARWKDTLVTSDGSATLRFRDPNNLKEIRSIQVKIGSTAITNLNDLTTDANALWSNVWHRSEILRIHPENGQVTGILSLEKLTQSHQNGNVDNVLNGIAWDASTNSLWVTGKRWTRLYQLQLITH